MNDRPRTPDHDRADHDELRDLFEDAVADVEPRHGLDAIRARTSPSDPTKVTAMTDRSSRRSWAWAGGAAVATAATLLAVTVLTNGDDTPEASPADGPTTTATAPEPTEPTDTQEPPTDTSGFVEVFVVGDTDRGPRLYRESVEVRGTMPLPVLAVDRAMQGGEIDPDHRSAWAGTQASVRLVELQGDQVVVDVVGGSGLRERPAGMSAEEASIGVEQVVRTALSALEQSLDVPVQLLLEGERTDQLLGVPVAEPLAAGSPLDTESLAQIISPADRSSTDTPFGVEGFASCFEATVVWRLEQDGNVVEESFTTAEGWMDGLYPYTFTVEDVPRGDYTLIVTCDDPSGGTEGISPDQDTKQITIG